MPSMKHRCQRCQRVFRIVDYVPGTAYLCDACSGRLQTIAEGADPRLVHNPEIDLFEPESLLGKEVGGWRLIGLLGSGGSGAVYLAVRPGSDAEAAVKVLHPRLATDKRSVHRFLREGRTIGRLSSPSLPRLLDSGEAASAVGTLPYLVTEYAAGGSVADRLEEGPLEPARALEIARDVARGLAVAHQAGVVHRDVKPANILLDGDGNAKIADFGLARIDGSTALTGSHAVVGTPNYIAPEQVAERTTDGRTDVYALGATLYHMLCGRPPFSGRLLQVLRSHASEDPVPPSRVRPEVPAAWDGTVLRMLAKRPEDRYPSCSEVIEDLAALLEGKPPLYARRLEEIEAASPEGLHRARFHIWPVVAAIGWSRLALTAAGLAAWGAAVAWKLPADPRPLAPLAAACVTALAVPAGAAIALARGRFPRRPGVRLVVHAAAAAVAGAYAALHPSPSVLLAAALPLVLLADAARRQLDARRRPRLAGKIAVLPGESMPPCRFFDQEGYPIARDDLLGRRTLLALLCGPDCAACRVELAELDRRVPAFRRAGVRLFGVDLASPAVNRRLRQRCDLEVSVLADSEEAFSRWLGFGGGRTRPTLAAFDDQGVLEWAHATDDHRTRLPAAEVLERLGVR